MNLQTQPPSVSKKPWYNTAWGVAATTAGSVLIIFFACCGSLAILSARLSALSAASATPTATVASQATQPVVLLSPTATAKPQPQPVSGPYLGGTQSEFTAVYGDPTVAFGIPSYDITIGNTPVHLALSDINTGSDGQQRVEILMVADPNGAAWDAATSAAVISKLLPLDARHIRDDQTPDVGTLHVYQSASLALSFPASAFTNGNGGGPEPPGTLSYTCDSPGTIGCTLSIGE